MHMFKKLNPLRVLNALYFPLIVAGFAVMLWISRFVNLSDYQWLAWSLVFGWILGSRLATIYAIKLYCNKINKKLTEYCDPDAYIVGYEKLLRKCPANTRTSILLCLCSGYSYNGDLEKMKEALDKINSTEKFYNTKYGILNKVGFFASFSSYYRAVNDVQKAEAMLENMKSALENPKLGAKFRRRYDDSYTTAKFYTNILKGEYDGAEEYLCAAFDRAGNKLEKVMAKYTLGKTYIHFGNVEKAKKAFEYVIENGNKIFFVRKAAEYLGTIV